MNNGHEQMMPIGVGEMLAFLAYLNELPDSDRMLRLLDSTSLLPLDPSSDVFRQGYLRWIQATKRARRMMIETTSKMLMGKMLE